MLTRQAMFSCQALFNSEAMRRRSRMKRRFQTLFSIALLWSLFGSASAHNVLGTVYAIGSDIEGAIGFSDGKLAPEGSIVTITDPAGNLLGEVRTDAEGVFVYAAQHPVDHHIRADLGSGHIYQAILPIEEIGFTAQPLSPVSLKNADGESGSSERTESGGSPTDLDIRIEKAVARQIQPLVQELNAYKEKAGWQDILGALGYIFGLCGLLMIWKARKIEQER